MYTYALALLAQTGGGLGWRDVVADVPHDPAAIFVYALVAVSLFLVWKGSRNKAGPQ